MAKPVIKAAYIGPRDNTADLLVQARKIHAAAVTEYKESSRKARRSIIPKIVAIKKRATRIGLKNGYRRALKETSEKYAEIDRIYVNTVRQANQTCLAIALEIAKDILGHEVELNQRGLADKIQRLLDAACEDSKVTVHVNPRAGKAIQELLGDRLENQLILNDLEIPAGNALLQFESGEIAINWRTQLKEAARIRLEQLEVRIQTLSEREGHDASSIK